MADIKKVIKGLEACAESRCNHGWGCPYEMEDRCIERLATDALALLKAQQPRVMTLREARRDIEVWYESINGACGYGDLCYDANAELAIYMPHGIKGVKEDAYGKTWRCWTSRPTEAQMKAVKWGG